MTAFYNEIDPFAAQWLRNLIAAGQIAPGVVDTRSIEELTADDLKGFTQVHFFAGIGIWSYALRCAGWPDDRPVWTGSCPCQPFSAAGKRTGTADQRHLWPVMSRLIRECLPGVVFGEQVSSADGLAWFDSVQSDLENANYAATAVDLCAAGIGAPHIRQRLYWVADSISRFGRGAMLNGTTRRAEYSNNGAVSSLADTNGDGRQGRLPGRQDSQRQAVNGSVGCSRTDSGLADATIVQCRPRNAHPGGCHARGGAPGLEQHVSTSGPLDAANDNRYGGPTNGYWGIADWLSCRDGKWRPVRPGSFPLVNGTVSRVGRLRAYGNALVAPVASTFISAYMEATNDEQF